MSFMKILIQKQVRSLKRDGKGRKTSEESANNTVQMDVYLELPALVKKTNNTSAESKRWEVRRCCTGEKVELEGWQYEVLIMGE